MSLQSTPVFESSFVTGQMSASVLTKRVVASAAHRSWRLRGRGLYRCKHVHEGSLSCRKSVPYRSAVCGHVDAAEGGKHAHLKVSQVRLITLSCSSLNAQFDHLTIPSRSRSVADHRPGSAVNAGAKRCTEALCPSVLSNIAQVISSMTDLRPRAKSKVV